MLWLLQPTANYNFAIIEGYLAGNAEIKISIKCGFHIRLPLANVANRKCGPENCIFEKSDALITFMGGLLR